MDKLIEEKFVKNFIKKEEQESVLVELFSQDKRNKVISSLYWVLDRRYAVLDDNKISDSELMSEVSNFFDVNDNCYVISALFDDGQVMPFKKALENMPCYEMGCFIICGDNTVLGADADNRGDGLPYKILLHKEN